MAETLADMYKRLSENPAELEAAWQQDIPVDTDSIEDELSRAAEVRGNWGRLAVMAEAVASDLESAKDFAWANARAKARVSLNGGRVTEGAVDDLAHLDLDYIRAEKKYREAHAIAVDFREIAESMAQRVFTIQGLNRRQTPSGRHYAGVEDF